MELAAASDPLLSSLDEGWASLILERHLEGSVAGGELAKLKEEGYTTLQQVLGISPETWKKLGLKLVLHSELQDWAQQHKPDPEPETLVARSEPYDKVFKKYWSKLKPFKVLCGYIGTLFTIVTFIYTWRKQPSTPAVSTTAP